MSLKVWLPLNGNLKDNGLSRSFTTIFGAEISNSGKIGQTYTFDGSDDYISIENPALYDCFKGGNTPFTFAVWIYNSKATGNRGVIFGDYGLTGTINFNIEMNSSSNWNNDIRFYWAGSPDYRATGTEITSNTWVHLTISYDGNNLYFYKNGTLVHTREGVLAERSKTSGAYYLGRDSRTGNTAFSGSLNDFRVYDECLSAKQIKEISKGLVCHYKLSTPGSINNLKRNATYSVYNNFASSGTTGSLTKLTETFNGCSIYRLTMTPDESHITSFQTALYAHGIYGFSTTFLANTKYCFWILWRPVSHNDVVVGGNASNIGNWTAIPSKQWGSGWNIVGQTRDGSVTTNKTDSIFTSFKCPSAESGVPISIDFCCPHLVEGYDYILDEFDYKGTNPPYEQDCSGNGYNATKNGTLIFNSNSPRHDGSIHVDGSSYLQTTSPSTEARTISLWVKWDSIPSGQSVVYVDYKSKIGLGLMSSGILCSSGGISSKTFSKANIVANTWYHFVIVNPGDANTSTDRDLYINGVKQTPTTNTSNWTFSIDYLQIGKRSTTSDGFIGQISDFRMYATALSAEEILTLYKNSGIIDNNGDVYTREFKEV